MVNYDKIGELFQQDAFKKDANECKTMEDFHSLFIKNGVEITEDETIELISQIAEKKQKMDNGEISEDELDEVAGGIVILGVTLTVAQAVALGIAGVGAAALGAWNGYHKTRKKK